MRKAILILAILGGILAAVGNWGLAASLALLVIVRPEAVAENRLIPATLALAAGLVGAGLGVLLAWHGWQAWRAAPGRVLRLPRWGWWAGALAVGLAGGQAASLVAAGWAMPVLHLAAAVIPAGLLLALALGSARRANGAAPVRAMLGSLSWGMFGAVGSALALETLLGVVLVAAVAIGLMLTRPDLAAQLEGLVGTQGMTGSGLDPDMLMSLLRLPLVWLGVLGMVSGLAPLIEEGVKSLAVPLMGLAGRRLTRLDGFLLGAAAGAGFAIFEGVGNGAAALAIPERWGALMLLRSGATAMHCLASGLAGLAWQAILTERRLARGLGLAVLALALHGVWNAAAVGASLVSTVTAGLGANVRLAGGLTTVILMGGVAVLALGAAVALAVVPRRLARSASPQAAAPAPATL